MHGTTPKFQPYGKLLASFPQQYTVQKRLNCSPNLFTKMCPFRTVYCKMLTYSWSHTCPLPRHAQSLLHLFAINSLANNMLHLHTTYVYNQVLAKKQLCCYVHIDWYRYNHRCHYSLSLLLNPPLFWALSSFSRDVRNCLKILYSKVEKGSWQIWAL